MNEVTRILSAIEQGDSRGGRATPAPGLRRAAQARRPETGAARSPARRSRPPPWSTRPTCGSSAHERPGLGRPRATSSPPPPRRCGASSSRPPAASGAGSAAAASPASTSTPSNPPPPGPSPRPPGPRRGPRPARGQRAPGRRAGQAPLLRRPDRRGGRARPGHLAPNGRQRLGLRPGLARHGPPRRGLNVALGRDSADFVARFGRHARIGG